ncbi:MAG: hypothetical protein DLM59_19715 [Pseudonocardiales bacterium]|nr:MAG: hypothetical protein DLM59_19715 [Pseudonocardiales bacterium]
MRLPVIGYLRVGSGDPPEASTGLVRQMGHFAVREGLALAHVFVEHGCVPSDYPPHATAFCAVMDALGDPDVYGVLVPSLDHLSAFPGTGAALRTTIEHETGARVFVMSGPFSGS